MTQIWRINLKSEGKDPRKFCLKRSVLGVGWPVDHDGVTCDWDKYYEAGMAKYYNNKDRGWWPAINAIKNNMQINDLCWTRLENGIYYIGRITGGWRYNGSDEHNAADVVNIRDCDWRKVGPVDKVPGKVVNSFIPSRTLQRVEDDNVRLYSCFLYNLLGNDTSSFTYLLTPLTDSGLFKLISSDDCEDVVGLYLQEQGWRVIPSTCKMDTAAYEFVMKHSASGATAVLQVKQGSASSLNEQNNCPDGVTVFWFATDGDYSTIKNKTIHLIDPHEIEKFVFKHPHLLSDRVTTWIEMIDKLRS